MHGVHATERSPANVPALHSVGVLMPLVGHALPAGQIVHTLLPATE